MSTDTTRDVYRGFGLLLPTPPDGDPRDRLLASGALSGDIVYTEASPRVGMPVADDGNRGRLHLLAAGDLDAALSVDLEVRAQRGGLPSPDGVAGVVWRRDGDTRWCGWNPPASISAWEAIAWTDGSPTYLGHETRDPHALGLPNGKVVCVYQSKVTSPSTSYRVRCSVRGRDGTWSTVTIASQTDAPTTGFYPCLWRVPLESVAEGGATGALYCAFWVDDLLSSPELANVQVYRSDDDGASWTLVQKQALRSSISIDSGAAGYDVGRIRAAYSRGQTCMIAELKTHDTANTTYTRDLFVQHAALDEGCDFRHVATWSKSETGTRQGGKYLDLLVIDGRFTLFYLTHDINVVAAGRPVYRQVGAAFESFLADAENEVDGGTAGVQAVQSTATGYEFTDGDLCAVEDSDGMIYVLTREAVDENNGVIYRSDDRLRTWRELGVSSGTIGHWWYGRDAATTPASFCAATVESRLVLLHNWLASPGNEDNSLGALYLGGWSDIVLPDLTGAPYDATRVGFERTWLPFDTPDAVGWTANTGGTSTAALASPGCLALTTTAGQQYYDITVTTTPTQGLLVRAEVRVNSGGSITTDDAAFRLTASNGTTGHDVSIRLKTDSLEVYDHQAAAVVGSTATVDLTDWKHLLIALANGAITVAWAPGGAGSPQRWTVTHDGEAIDSAAITTDGVAVGLGLDGNCTAAMDLRLLAYTDGLYTGRLAAQLAGGQDNPGDLYPGRLSSGWRHLTTEVAISAQTGPTVVGDTWTIGTAADYPVEALLPQLYPSPQITWRSVDDSAAVSIGLSLDSLADTRLGGDTVVCALFGCAQRLHYLEGRKAGSGAWTTLATLNTAVGASAVPFQRSGSAIEPDVATTGGEHPFLHAGQFSGGWARLDTNKIRRIVRQTAGVWKTADLAGTFQLPILTLDGAESGDPATGTAQLWAPNVCAIVHMVGERYAQYRVRIPIQETPLGYFQIGTLFFGEARLLGRGYAWGRGWSYQSGTQLEDLEDGRTMVHDAAPDRRLFTLAWEAVQTYGAWGNEPAPDYAYGSTDTGARVVATPQATPFELIGIWREVGAREPLLYLSRVPVGPPNAVVTTDPNDFALVRFVGPPRLEAVAGSEQQDEVLTVTLDLREEL